MSLAAGRRAHPSQEGTESTPRPPPPAPAVATFTLRPPEHPGRPSRAGSRELLAYVPTTHFTEEKAEASVYAFQRFPLTFIFIITP